LIRNKDILSLVLIIDKIKLATQISNLRNIPQEYFDELEANTPEHLKVKVREIITMFLMKLDVPKEEIVEFNDKILKGGVSTMFDLLDNYSVTRTRDETRDETRKETRNEIASNMIACGYTTEDIVKLTNLTKEEVESLRSASDLAVVG